VAEESKNSDTPPDEVGREKVIRSSFAELVPVKP
jgi:hypothetical protein